MTKAVVIRVSFQGEGKEKSVEIFLKGKRLSSAVGIFIFLLSCQRTKNFLVPLYF